MIITQNQKPYRGERTERMEEGEERASGEEEEEKRLSHINIQHIYILD